MGRMKPMPPRKPKAARIKPRLVKRNTTCAYCTQPDARSHDDRCTFCGHNFFDHVIQGIRRDAEVWRVNHPMQLTWITINREKSGFARSIFTALDQFGGPTPKQQAALDRITLGNP